MVLKESNFMTELEASFVRHSVRKYKDIPMTQDVVSKLQSEIDKLNAGFGYNIQLVLECDEAVFNTDSAYSRLKGVRNYLALVGPDRESLDEELGYYGEKLVLIAQTLGLNTCWVVLTYDNTKTDFVLNDGERLVSLIAIGYGEHEGRQHNNKDIQEISDLQDSDPAWYRSGVECALNAPTALNQQKFYISRDGNKVSITTDGSTYTYIDLGIVKYHFELGAGSDNFTFVE